MTPENGQTPEDRLEDAEQRRNEARRILARKTASLEALVQGRSRIRAIVDRLREEKPTAAEEKMLNALTADAKDFAERIDDLRAEQERQEQKMEQLGDRIQELRRRLEPGDVTMYDSVTVSEIPPDADAAAGYTSGNWPTWLTIKSGPWPRKLSIAVTASHDDAECLDVEPGDAEPEQAPGWVQRAKQRGIQKPVLYASLSRDRKSVV